MIEVSSQFGLSIKIDGNDYDLTSSAFEKLSIFENTNKGVPDLELYLIDNKIKTDELPISDGSLIEILITYLTEEEKTQDWIPFRVFSTEVITLTHGDSLKIVGYYDAPDYFISSQFQSFNNSSYSVVSTIAQQSELESEVDISADNQTWIRSGITGYSFLSNIVRHSYKDQNSAFAISLTRSGVLRFFNVGERYVNNDPIWSFVETNNDKLSFGKEEIPYLDGYLINQSGLFNKFSAYGVISTDHRLVPGTDVDIQINELNKTNDHIQVNRDLLSLMRYEHMPINVGNTHSNYAKAKLQNTKILSLFSSFYKLQTSRPKDVNLLDLVQVQSKHSDGSRRTSVNGKYFVTGIRTDIDNSSLVTTYRLCRAGINSTGELTNLL